MSTRDIRTPDEIVINVGRGEGDDAEKAKRRGAPLPGSKPDDGIRTRRKTGAIRFFDIAQTRLGDGWTFDRSGVSTLPWVNAVGTGPADVYTEPTTPGPGAFDSIIAAELASAPADQWNSNFYQIPKGAPGLDTQIYFATNGDPGSLAPIADSPKWKSGGLELGSGDLPGLIIFGANPFFGSVIDFSTAYFTETNDPGAAHVAFTPTRAMDIFLIPDPVLAFANTYFINGIHSDGSLFDFIYWFEAIAGSAGWFDRAKLADYLALDDLFGDPYQFFRATVALVKTFPDVGGIQRQRDFDSGGTYFITDRPRTPFAFPWLGIYTPDGIVESPAAPPYTDDLGYNGGFNDLRTTIALKAVIRAAGRTLYVW